MPLSGPADPLPHRPRRVLVAGTSGSGKTSLAVRIAAALHVRHVEIDALFHGPAWTPRPSFERDVHHFSAGPAWVTEWQYGSVRAHLAERADLVVWLDLPRHRVMRQVVRRTLVRRLRRQQLWNGNIEPSLWTFFTDPDHIVRWAWLTHHKTATRVTHLLRQHPDLTVVRLRSHRDAEAWLSGPLHHSTRHSS
ncbi:adenylate kinase family enzyme [Kineococcus xinjiangensis]|uniref:Adenylate kinase family enzyme n=1 Tax=Kineococcus xinjiangensis TaxID=512762 RepID=A0A2S6IDG3_9ACTN|nr:AAA family ATPase [Kineococcus xinjiangensis]PPK92264.1 adenylate kinase family enzyme [Kineococcus xinjiangensis]